MKAKSLMLNLQVRKSLCCGFWNAERMALGERRALFFLTNSHTLFLTEELYGSADCEAKVNDFATETSLYYSTVTTSIGFKFALESGA